MGPAMPMVRSMEILAVLLLLPIVKPEMLLPNDQKLPTDTAEPKLLAASNGKTLTVPEVLNAAVLLTVN